MHSTIGLSIYRLSSLGLENEAKNKDFKKPKIYALIVLDVVADVATLQLWCRGSTFGVATLHVDVVTLLFACPYNVATFL